MLLYCKALKSDISIRSKSEYVHIISRSVPFDIVRIRQILTGKIQLP